MACTVDGNSFLCRLLPLLDGRVIHCILELPSQPVASHTCSDFAYQSVSFSGLDLNVWLMLIFFA
jgi:hypothetical protein